MYTSYSANMTANGPPRRRLPDDFSRPETRRRNSDPCPCYTSGRHRLTPEERDILMDFFRTHSSRRRETRPPPRTQPSAPRPEPVVPPEELKKELHVVGIDLHIDDNSKAHHTTEYDCTDPDRTIEGVKVPAELVVRRGQEFKMTIEFNRAYDRKENDLALIFTLGSSVNGKRTLEETVNVEEEEPKSKKFKKWRAYLSDKTGKHLTVSVFIPPNSPVGEWGLRVRTVVGVKNGEDIVWNYVHNQDVTVLFNPWCKKDVVYVEDKDWLNEAVLNDSGVIYIGSAEYIGHNEWNFGQFEDGVLDVCLHLLRKAFDGEATPLMGHAVDVVRALSAIVNSNDDSGVLSGNWSGNYERGTNPSDWVGSVNILKEYAKGKGPVRYGQCWVFSGLLTTVCRALGIPCRSVTNFESAHNSDLCHLSCDVINKKNRRGEWYEERTDSVWNFHVWNEVWMSRPDLKLDGKDYGGWQVIDATPQERSDNIFQCGPCPLKAIKQGDIPIGYDTAFVFAEVNGDKIEWTEHPKTKVLYQMEKEKDAIGKYISTHCPTGEPLKDAEKERLDLTSLYKYEEGSQKEREIVRKAERLFRSANFDDDDDDDNDPPQVVDVALKIEKPEKVDVGETIPVVASAVNNGSIASNINLFMEIVYVDYRRRNKGVAFTKKTSDMLLKPKQKTEIKHEMDVASVLKHPEFGLIFKINVVMELKEVDLTKKKSFVIRVNKPKLQITGPDLCGLDESIDVIVKLTNPLAGPLTKCLLKMEGGVKMKDKKTDADITEIQIGTIKGKETWSTKLTLKPNKVPRFRPFRCCQLVLSCKEIGSVYGTYNLRIKQKQQS